MNIPLASFNLSGGIKVLVVLANEMTRAGATVKLIVPDFAAKSPFPLHPDLLVQSNKTASFLPLLLRRMLHYFRLLFSSARDCDLVLANYYPTALCGWVSRGLFGRNATVLWYLQGHEAGSHGLLADASWIGRRLRYSLARLAYRLPVRLICVSNWVKENADRPDAEIIHPPALHLETFRSTATRSESNECVIGVIGRSEPTKGYDVFLKAVSMLPHDSRLQVLVVSAPGGKAVLPSSIHSEAVMAQGESQMAEFYRRCDIFVVSSRMESFALPALEAMASGCAVVVTACGGVSEYAQPGNNCLIVPVDDPDAMAHAISELARSYDLRLRLSTAGRETAERFAPEVPLRQFIATVRNSVNRSP